MKIKSRLKLRHPNRRALGFTLIELVTVVLIIGILSTIAIAKYGDLLRKSKEGALQGDLGSFRSAISIYYADMEGQYPSDLQSLTISSKYLASLPSSAPAYFHAASAQIGSVLGDVGGWGYDSDSSSVRFGSLWVNCTHTDSKATTWSSY